MDQHLLCRKPRVFLLIPGCKDKPLMRRFFGWRCKLTQFITGAPFGSYYRESFKLDNCCPECRDAVNALPSYKEAEAIDREIYPNAVPCGCDHSQLEKP